MSARRTLPALALIGALAAPAAVAATAGPPAFFGYVEASDTIAHVLREDERDYLLWPTNVDQWSAAVSTESTGPTGQESPGATYHVRSSTSQTVDPTFAGGNLVAIDVDLHSRVDTSVSGCTLEDDACRASGQTSTQAEIGLTITGATRITLRGTLDASVGDASPDGLRCSVNLYALHADRNYLNDCDIRQDPASRSWTFEFDEVVPTGGYELDINTAGFSNAYPWNTSGFMQVSADIRLELDATDEPEDPGDEEVDFDWSVPDSYGLDEAAPVGLIDSYAPDGTLDVGHAFPVDFVAEDSSPCDTERSRTWLIDGSPATGSAAEPTPCGLRYTFTDEGVYDVTLEVRGANGNLLGSVAREVVVQDWLIVSIGDSVASGEGTPDIVTAGAPETWQNQQCHRTALAGPAQAAALLEAADPKTSVTFVHLACSGATIAEGLLGAYAGIEAGIPLPPQLNALTTFAQGREVDAITVSIGANDVKFGKIVEMCVRQVACNANQPGKAARLFYQKVVSLPGSYADLDEDLDSRGVQAARVFLTQYFDPMHDDAGAICDGTVLADAPFVGPGGIHEITATEATWASTSMLRRLDQEGRNAASVHGWHFVDGIQERFLTHGYCANDHWVVRMIESFARQGDPNGTLHPNVLGHAVYGTRIATALSADLYDGGDLSKPRPPAE